MLENHSKLHALHNDPDFSIATPRFDGAATATAQPVEPIPVNRLARFKHKAGSVARLFHAQTRALAAVVIIGLFTGALGGVLLANRSEQQRLDASASRSLDVSEAVALPAEDQIDGRASSLNELSAAPEQAQSLDAFANQLGGTSGTTPVANRVRRTRSRGIIVRAPRAYRVAVIR